MIIDLIFVAIILVLAYATVHYRAQAKATSTTSSSAVAVLEAQLAVLGNDVRATLDSKFKALGQWLTSELAKVTVPPPANDPAAPAVPDASANPPAETAPAAVTAAPSADSGGTDTPEALVAKINETVAALTAKRARIEEAQKAKQAADASLKEALAS